MKPNILIATLCALVMVGVADASAQGAAQRGQQAQQAEPSTRPASEVTLVYEREQFAYAPAGRRDPFRPLTEDDELGPRFEQLSLRGVIYAPGRGRSVALLGEGGRSRDGGGRVYRVREGDVLGNIRIVEIGPQRVVMAVETFGTVRREMLELQRRGEAQR
jgi:hypothetical protein